MKSNKLGIALSGGGARGIVHIGVLQALEELAIAPNCISGASAGAIAGFLYAAGLSPMEMLSFVEEVSLLKTFRFGLPTKGLADLGYLRGELERLVPHRTFEELEKKLFISIANLNTGLAEIVHSGKVIDYVIASSSIPLIFKPSLINGVTYVDGGLLNNLPVAPLQRECDHIIGVNVLPITEVPNNHVDGLLSIGIRCFEVSIRANIRENLQKCDVVIEPQEVTNYNIFNIRKAKELFEIGYRETMKNKAALLSLVK